MPGLRLRVRAVRSRATHWLTYREVQCMVTGLQQGFSRVDYQESVINVEGVICGRAECETFGIGRVYLEAAQPPSGILSAFQQYERCRSAIK